VAIIMSQGNEGFWEKLSRLSPHVEASAVVRTLTELDREFGHLPHDQRLLFLAEALRKRSICSSFQECLEMATLWVTSNPSDQMDRESVVGRAATSPDQPEGGRSAAALGLGATASPRRGEGETSPSVGERERVIRELIRMIVAQIESSCGWSERELVSVERDGVAQILDLLRLLRGEPELFDYAIETVRELLDRLEAERKASVRRIRREAETEQGPVWGEGGG
jgi:hypothetical protein